MQNELARSVEVKENVGLWNTSTKIEGRTSLLVMLRSRKMWGPEKWLLSDIYHASKNYEKYYLSSIGDLN